MAKRTTTRLALSTYNGDMYKGGFNSVSIKMTSLSISQRHGDTFGTLSVNKNFKTISQYCRSEPNDLYTLSFKSHIVDIFLICLRKWFSSLNFHVHTPS